MLPGYEIKNALVDFSPVTQAIESNQANALARRRADNEDQRLGMERERLNMTRQQHADAQKEAVRRRIGGQALAALQETDPARLAAAHQTIIGMHPDANSLPAHYRDNPKAGLMAILGDAGMADDYLKLRIQQEAAGRAAALHPYQLQNAQLDTAIKKREVDNPADTIQKVRGPDGEEYLVRVPKRQGEQAQVIYQPQPAGTAGEARPIVDPKKKAEVEHSIRSEIQKLTGDYRTVRDASGNLEGLGQNATAAGDIALIYSFMKILDPGSVVRETEFATAQNAAGVPDQVRNVFNRILSGERLNPQQRADFLNQARTIAAKQLGQYQRTLDQYKGVAQRSGVDQRNVIIDQDLLSPPGQTASGNSTVGTPLNGAPAESVPVLTPEQARRAPPGTVFRTNDGRVMRVPAR